MVGSKGHDTVSAGGHPAVHAERGRNIAGQVTIVAVKSLDGVIWLRHEGLHLHIGGRHQSAGHAVQVDTLVPLIDVVGIQIRRLTVRAHQSGLDLQRPFQLWRQCFPAFRSSAQDPQTCLRG